MRTLFALIAMSQLLAASPVIKEVYPHGAKRGTTFTLELRGTDLAAGAKVETALPASFSRLVPSTDPMRAIAELPFLVVLKPDVPVGLYPVRLLTDDGYSNVVLFAVGDFPEVEENETKNPKELNDTLVTAQPVPVPSTVSGTLSGADVDHFSFNAKASQKLVFEVIARRAGSAVDPAIEILDAAGHEIARNDDAPGIGVDSRVQVTFAKNGKYFVRLHDTRYSDQTQNFYRLTIAAYDFADGIFPLGGRRGEPANVSLLGGNLAAPVVVKPDVNTTGALTPVRLPGSPTLPFWFALSDKRELLEPASGDRALDDGVVMNGRIDSPGEVDAYRVAVKPRENWFIELVGASLGSPIEGLITIFDEKGKKLASRAGSGGLDAILPFTVPADVNAISVAVEDQLGRGGPAFAYRLEARRQEPDFTAELLTPFVNVPRGGTAQVPVLVRRRGYQGPLRVRIQNLPDGFVQAGGHVPNESADQSFNTDNQGFRTARTVITITASPDAKPVPAQLTVVAEATTADGKIVRRAAAPGLVTAIKGERQKPFTAAWLNMALPMAMGKPIPVAIDTPVPMARLSQGFDWPINYTVRRASGAKMPVLVDEDTVGNVGNLRILKPESKDKPEGKDPDSGHFELSTNFATPATWFDVLLEAEVEIAGKTVNVTSPAIEVEVVPGYDVTLDKPKLELEAGRPLTITGKVRREPTFEGGVIRVAAGDLPDDVKCASAEVPADSTAFAIACEATPAAKPGSYPIRITSVAPNTGRKAKEEYKVADIDTNLIVMPIAKAAR